MGIAYVFAAYSPIVLPSAHHAPPPLPPIPGQAPPPATADNRELWARDAERFSDLFGGARYFRAVGPICRSWTANLIAWPSAKPTCKPSSKRVAAVVHHGGAGTTTTAALAGAPQVVIPQIYDQHYWARRVQHLRIGTTHRARQPSNRSVQLSSTLCRPMSLHGQHRSPRQCGATTHALPHRSWSAWTG